MKSFIVFLIAIVVIGFVACSSKDLSTVEVSVLYDITEKKSVVPNIDEIISLYNFENKYNGGVFKLIEITDVSFNPVLFAKIDAELVLLLGNKKPMPTPSESCINKILAFAKEAK